MNIKVTFFRKAFSGKSIVKQGNSSIICFLKVSVFIPEPKSDWDSRRESTGLKSLLVEELLPV